MNGVAQQQTVVDFVAEDEQLVLTSHFHQFLQQLRAVDDAGGVVGVDDEDGAGALGDEALDLLGVGLPVVLLVAAVEHRGGLCQVGGVGPQGVAGGRDQNLVAGVEQGGQAHGSQFADAVADVDIIRSEAGDALALFISPDGLTGGGHTFEVAVSNGFIRILHQSIADGVGHLETKGCRIAGVQLQNGDTGGAHAVRFLEDRTTDIRMDFLHSACTHNRIHRRFLLIKICKFFFQLHYSNGYFP